MVTPFLPGDSLLFAAGTFAATGSLEITILSALLSAAAVAGNTLNYQIGYLVGPKVFGRGNARFLKKEYVDRTQRYYEKYGGLTIVIARFVPIVRTFAPFLAGVGKMAYWRFAGYNMLGSIAWISVFIFGGYYFGNLPVVRQNFTLVIFAIILLSILPSMIEFFRHRR